MGSEGHNLHVFCIPYMAQGHVIPMVDLAKLFAKHGVKVGLIATPHDPASVEKIIAQTRSFGHQIKTHLLEFPSTDAELHNRSKNLDSVSSHDDVVNLISSMEMFQEPLARLVDKHRPDCIVSDFFFPWTVQVTAKFGIPRPHDGVASDSEPFVVPGLPHHIQLTRSQLPSCLKMHNGFSELFLRIREADHQSFGFVMNSFYELEQDYVEHYKSQMGKKTWSVGPLSLCNRSTLDMAERGKKASIDPEECLKWLSAKKPDSVVYVCLGSMGRFHPSQLLEIALALESSGRPFLWVVGDSNNGFPENEWLPEGLEKRVEGRGLIIRGWAPQVLILNHPAVGAFVTHCGWNSILEGVSSGVTMITWPICAEQFYNEKLITRVLEIGVPVGSEVWTSWEDRNRPLIRKEKIEKAIAAMMDGGDESERMRKRAKELGEMALRAVEVGGSSHADMSRLINELKTYGQGTFGMS